MHGDRHPLALRLMFLGKQLGHLMERRLADRGINRTQTMILIGLSHHPGLKILDLCGPAGVEPANVSRTLQSLERLGLLERQPHPTDGRANLIYLTPLGESLAAELKGELQRISAELLEGIHQGDLSHLELALGALHRAVGRQLSALGLPSPMGPFRGDEGNGNHPDRGDGDKVLNKLKAEG